MQAPAGPFSPQELLLLCPQPLTEAHFWAAPPGAVGGTRAGWALWRLGSFFPSSIHLTGDKRPEPWSRAQQPWPPAQDLPAGPFCSLRHSPSTLCSHLLKHPAYLESWVKSFVPAVSGVFLLVYSRGSKRITNDDNNENRDIT